MLEKNGVSIFSFKTLFTLCFSRRAESSLSQLENDSKRLRVELQTSRQGEQELRSTMHSLMASERSTKVELQQLKSECEVIQQK